MNSYAYILAPIVGWIVAQGIKFTLSLRKEGIRWDDLVRSGGMPSSHSAFMVSLATAVGIENGFFSTSFGIALALTGIIIYDAMGVRRTTGQQTDAIFELAKAQKIKLKTDINISRGHTPAEVIVGSFIGVIVGLICTALL
jgi:hypothetical protein